MEYIITGQDWGDPIDTVTVSTEDEAIDAVFAIRDKHPGAIISINGGPTIDLSQDFELFGKEYA